MKKVKERKYDRKDAIERLRAAGLLDIVHNSDAFDWFRLIPRQSVNLWMVDLPYKVTDVDWDGKDAKLTPGLFFLYAMSTLAPHGNIVLTTQQPFTTEIMMVDAARKSFSHHSIFVKNRATNFQNAAKMPMRSFEEVLMFKNQHANDGTIDADIRILKKIILENPKMSPKKIMQLHDELFVPPSLTEDIMVMNVGAKPTYNPQMRKRATAASQKIRPNKSKSASMQSQTRIGETVTRTEYYPDNLLPFDADPDPVHPTQKPVDLGIYLVETYSNPGDVVADCCMGSFWTAKAAHATGRHFIGCELSSRHFSDGLVSFNKYVKELAEKNIQIPIPFSDHATAVDKRNKDKPDAKQNGSNSQISLFGL